MSRFIYCPRKSQTAQELCRRLEAERIRHFDGLNFWDKSKRVQVEENDTLICWGGSLYQFEGFTVINGTTTPVPWFQDPPNGEVGTPTTFGSQFSGEDYLRAYPTEGERIIGRRRLKKSGDDLLNNEPPFDYWAIKYTVDKEFRIHVFDGKVILVGERVLKEGYVTVPENQWKVGVAHPWVRSSLGGWRISYDNVVVEQATKSIATNFVRDSRLNFGVVDIAISPNDRLGYHVLGFSTAPRLDEKGLEIYTAAFEKFGKKDLPKVEEEAIPIPPPPVEDPLLAAVRRAGRAARNRAAARPAVQGWAVNPFMPVREEGDE